MFWACVQAAAKTIAPKKGAKTNNPYTYLTNTTPIILDINNSSVDIENMQRECEATISELQTLFAVENIAGLKRLSQLDLVSKFLDPLVIELLKLSPKVTREEFDRYLVVFAHDFCCVVCALCRDCFTCRWCEVQCLGIRSQLSAYSIPNGG